MKYYVSLILLISLFGCEKDIQFSEPQNPVDTTNVEVDSTVIGIDTLAQLNNYWCWQFSSRNDSVYDDMEYIVKSYLCCTGENCIREYYKSLTLYANDFGLYSFDLTDMQRKNHISNTIDYIESLSYNSGYLRIKTSVDSMSYKIVELNDTLLVLAYESVMHNQIQINFKGCN